MWVKKTFYLFFAFIHMVSCNYSLNLSSIETGYPLVYYEEISKGRIVAIAANKTVNPKKYKKLEPSELFDPNQYIIGKKLGRDIWEVVARTEPDYTEEEETEYEKARKNFLDALDNYANNTTLKNQRIVEAMKMKVEFLYKEKSNSEAIERYENNLRRMEFQRQQEAQSRTFWRIIDYWYWWELLED